jgi:hypothetical protein
MRTLAIIRNPNNVPADVPNVFRVGEPIVPNGQVVKQILYCRDGYANGPGKDPVFVVKYVDIITVSQIPASEVVDVTIDPEDKAKKGSTDADVQLPD